MLLYRNLKDSFSIEVVTRSGRKFRYRIGEYMRQVQVDQAQYQLELLVNQAMAAKLKECEWDREHPLVDSSGEIGQALMAEFLRYQRWLKEQAGEEEMGT